MFSFLRGKDMKNFRKKKVTHSKIIVHRFTILRFERKHQGHDYKVSKITPHERSEFRDHR